MRSIGESFAWPFRGRWHRSWVPGVLAVLFMPLGFPFLLGYAVEATREAERDPLAGPPPWRGADRLLREGGWVGLAMLITVFPFSFVFPEIAGAIYSSHVWGSESVLTLFESDIVAGFVIALPWGLVALVWLPHATARFAASGRARDMIDVVASVRAVRHGFAAWNLAAAAIVTAWAIGLACAGLLCVGIVPGVYYAILVSAHACSTLETVSRPETTAAGAADAPRDPPAR